MPIDQFSKIKQKQDREEFLSTFICELKHLTNKSEYYISDNDFFSSYLDFLLDRHLTDGCMSHDLPESTKSFFKSWRQFGVKLLKKHNTNQPSDHCQNYLLKINLDETH